jgi:hypothetical protein
MAWVAASGMAEAVGTVRAVAGRGFCTRGLKAHGASPAMTEG